MNRPLTDAVMDAISSDDPSAVDRLIAHGIDIADRFGGQTLLGWAVMFGFPALAERLITAGANISDGDDEKNMTPLAKASFGGTGEIVTLLLKAGADPNRASEEGLTPLMMAAKEGHIAIVRELLERGANPRLRDINGLTALSWAVAWADHADVVLLLMGAGAAPDERDEQGITPLDRAVAMGYANAARVMRERALDPGKSIT